MVPPGTIIFSKVVHPHWHRKLSRETLDDWKLHINNESHWFWDLQLIHLHVCMRMSFYTKKTDSNLPKQHMSNAFCEFSRAQRQNPVYMKNKQASLASVHLYRLKNISNIQASWCQQFGPLRPQRFIAGTFSHITKSNVLNDVFRVLTCTGPHVFLVAILEGLGVVSLQPGNLRQRQLGVVSATFSPVSCWVNCRNNKRSNWNNFCSIPLNPFDHPSIFFRGGDYVNVGLSSFSNLEKHRTMWNQLKSPGSIDPIT